MLHLNFNYSPALMTNDEDDTEKKRIVKEKKQTQQNKERCNI